MTHRGPPNKFLPRLRGPLKVVERAGDTYTVRSLVTKRDERLHVKELRKYIHGIHGCHLPNCEIPEHSMITY